MSVCVCVCMYVCVCVCAVRASKCLFKVNNKDTRVMFRNCNCIYNPVKHLRLRVLRKQLTAFSR